MTEPALRLLDEAPKLTPEARELIALELLEGDGETHDVVEAAWADDPAAKPSPTPKARRPLADDEHPHRMTRFPRRGVVNASTGSRPPMRCRPNGNMILPPAVYSVPP